MVKAERRLTVGTRKSGGAVGTTVPGGAGGSEGPQWSQQVNGPRWSDGYGVSRRNKQVDSPKLSWQTISPRQIHEAPSW